MHGWFLDGTEPRFGWDDAPIASLNIPSPCDQAPLTHRRWDVDLHATNDQVLAFRDGSRLLGAQRHGFDFFLPWPVTGAGANVTDAHAIAGWNAYTRSYAVFPWRQIKTTLGEEQRTLLHNTVQAIAIACINTLAGWGGDRIGIEWALSASVVHLDGTLTPPTPTISALIEGLTESQEARLRTALEEGNMLAAAAVARILPDHASWMRCVQQGQLSLEQAGQDIPAMMFERAHHSLLYEVDMDHAIASAHGALQARTFLRALSNKA